MFKRSRQNMLSIFISFFIMSQDYYEVPRGTVRCNGNIYHVFNQKYFKDVQNVHQVNASMDLTLDKFKCLTSTCWNEMYKPLIIDMTKEISTGCY